MYSLGFDTSTACVSVALVGADGVLASFAEVVGNRQGEFLAPAVAQVFADAGVSVSELGAIGVGLGPGPFTGLRVGIVFAAAMGDALEVPVHGICSLDALAAVHAGDGDFVAMSDARRKEVYWARYDLTGARVIGPEVAKPAALTDELGGIRLVGAGAALYPAAFAQSEIVSERPYPDAATIATHARSLALAGAAIEVLTPLYLRRPDADESFVAKTVLA